MKHRLGTLIVLLLVECIKWTPPKCGSTAIGPCRWRLSIESWEEVGHPGAGMCDRSCLENNEVMFVFGPSKTPRRICPGLSRRAGVTVECSFTYNDFCLCCVGCVSGVVLLLRRLSLKKFLFAIMWVFIFQEMKQPALSGNGKESKANLRSSSNCIRKRVKR